jgi:uncharacterized protein (DUF433 family)
MYNSKELPALTLAGQFARLCMKHLLRPCPMEQKMDWKEHISIDYDVCHGRPCIAGTRIWVSLILDFLASGDSVDAILESYPHLSRDDIQACIAYGAEAARERFIPVPISTNL